MRMCSTSQNKCQCVFVAKPYFQNGKSQMLLIALQQLFPETGMYFRELHPMYSAIKKTPKAEGYHPFD